MDYVSPFDERGRVAEPLAPRPGGLEGTRIALLDINKRRGDEFLDPPVVVEHHPPELVQRADLLKGASRIGAPLAGDEILAQRLLVAREDVAEERKGRSGPHL